MNYKKLLKRLSAQEKLPAKELEREMQAAISAAGLNCTVEEFIKTGTRLTKETIYRIIV